MPKWTPTRRIKVRDLLTEAMGRVVSADGVINHRALAKLARVPLSNVLMFRDDLQGYVDSNHLVFIAKGERVAHDAVTETLAKELLAEEIRESLASELSQESQTEVMGTINAAVEKSWRNQSTRKVATDATELSEGHASTGLRCDTAEENYHKQLSLSERKDRQIERLENQVEKLSLIAGALIENKGGNPNPKTGSRPQ